MEMRQIFLHGFAHRRQERLAAKHAAGVYLRFTASRIVSERNYQLEIETAVSTATATGV